MEGLASGEDIAMANRKVSPEIRERAVRMVRESEGQGVVNRVAQQLGFNPETVRRWVRQAKIDQGEQPGLTSSERDRIRELEREVKELRRANEILKDASAFFARELDSRRSR